MYIFNGDFGSCSFITVLSHSTQIPRSPTPKSYDPMRFSMLCGMATAGQDLNVSTQEDGSVIFSSWLEPSYIAFIQQQPPHFLSL